MTRPRVEVICVGTELLTGKVNTHTAYLGPKLAEIGMTIAREHAVSDDEALMEEVFREAFKHADIVLCAGGLGPTFDDVTRDVWSRVLKRPLQFQPDLLTDIRAKFKARGIAMPPMNRRQALVLKGARVLPNVNGTAPGQIAEVGKKHVILFPGPSRELYPMMESFVIPHLKLAFPSLVNIQKCFLAIGVPESKLDAIVRPIVKRFHHFAGCEVIHGILASQSIVTLKFQVLGTNALRVRETAARVEKELRKKVAPYIFGEDRDTLEGVIGQMMSARKLKLAVAESCTGGLISKMLTDPSGASAFFVEGVTTYSNTSKVKRLGVSPKTLDKFGAVSKETAKEMAEGLRKKARVDFTLSVTGIAGPDGGTAEKPVGLVYIGCSSSRGTHVQEFRLAGDRDWIRHRAALLAINLLRKEVLRFGA